MIGRAWNSSRILLQGHRGVVFFAGLVSLAGCDGTSGTAAGELTCPEIAECADETDGSDDEIADCIEQGVPEDALLYSVLNDCALACDDDEACLGDCLPWQAQCVCGDGYIIDDGDGECVAVDNVDWLVAVTQVDVADACGQDGVGADEFFHIVALDGASLPPSSESDCYEDRYARWPASATWRYDLDQAFGISVWEADAFDDDIVISDGGFYNVDGLLGPLPADLLGDAAMTGTPQTSGFLTLFVDYE